MDVLARSRRVERSGIVEGNHADGKAGADFFRAMDHFAAPRLGIFNDAHYTPSGAWKQRPDDF
jgi:hypothetical protein